jgi:hypothetical protein
MENDDIILSDQTVGKEYQIPELVDLNVIGEAMGDNIILCISGTSNTSVCDLGSFNSQP